VARVGLGHPRSLEEALDNDTPHDPLTVALEYAKVLARVVKRMNVLGNAPYQFRFFM